MLLIYRVIINQFVDSILNNSDVNIFERFFGLLMIQFDSIDSYSKVNDSIRCISMQQFFCVHFHAWFKIIIILIIIIKSEFATQSVLTSYFCDGHLKNINRLITFSNILLKKRLFFITNSYDFLLTQNPPVTGNEHIPERKTVYCSQWKIKRAFNAITNAASTSTHYGCIRSHTKTLLSIYPLSSKCPKLLF